MAVESVYIFFRPVFVFCTVLGSFCSKNVFSKSSSELNFKYRSLTFVLFCFYHVILRFPILDYLIDPALTFDLMILHHLVINVVDGTMLIWMILGSKELITSLRLLDEIRESTIHNGQNLTTKRTNPVVFSWLMLLLLVACHGVSIILCPYFKRRGFSMKTTISILIMSLLSFHRLCALYTCVYYSCALVVYDTVQEWRYHFRARPPTPGFIQDFCHNIMTQTQLLRDINHLLENYIFVMLCSRVIHTISGSLFLIEMDSPVTANLIYLTLWIFFLGLLILTMSLTTDQYEQLKQEVLLLDTALLSKRERSMVRSLLAQLDNNPGEFSSGGFVKVENSLILTFASLGIEFLVMLAQYEESLRELVGLANN